MKQWTRITVRGIVQGVGFRPTVYRYAIAHNLVGQVRNTADGVVIEVGGTAEHIHDFLNTLQTAAPSSARIDLLRTEAIAPLPFTEFSIIESERDQSATALMPADLALCRACRAELLDPQDRRYRYPFINCTDCGPRYSVIETLPYDRSRTTMKKFDLCPACLEEYTNPASRRFHAEAICCPVCGPQIALVISPHSEPTLRSSSALQEAVVLIQAGKILAIKGLGGYHLACDPTHSSSVACLRQRKKRPSKPFAVMVRDLDIARHFVDLDESHTKLLQSPVAPIVLSPARSCYLAQLVAPDNGRVGVMLPYTPLHELLMESFEVLIMTSANLRDEPLVAGEARLHNELLGHIADAALVHDRPIAHPCDDSIFLPQPALVPVRRARGLVPDPIVLECELPCMLAAGSDLKNAFAVSRNNEIFLGPHQGDLEEAAALEGFVQTISDFCQLLEVRPEVCAHDCHPGYYSTQYVRSTGFRHYHPVQHHAAHVAACAAENGHFGSVIGVAWDGTGYGLDGAVWGGEFFVGPLHALQRAGQIVYTPLPGGDRAILSPWRMLAAWLYHANTQIADGEKCYTDTETSESNNRVDVAESWLADRGIDIEEWHQVQRLCAQGVFPVTSSAGRLFDAVAVAAGLGPESSFEGQLAIALENLCDETPGKPYPFIIDCETTTIKADFSLLWSELVHETDPAIIATRFHSTAAAAIVTIVSTLIKRTGISTVALSGGVFQNSRLTQFVIQGLRELNDLSPKILTHRLVPPNDGGIALGQLVIAGMQLAMNP